MTNEEADTYCGKCIKADVCGMEGIYDPAKTYCAYRVEGYTTEQVQDLIALNKKLSEEIQYSKIVYQAKIKELEDAISRCEQAEKEFKSRTCKFRSPTNCNFCSFHSDCDEHWKEGEEK